MVRKHCKVEPLRYYAACDRTGLIVGRICLTAATNTLMRWLLLPCFTGLHRNDSLPLLEDMDGGDTANRKAFLEELLGMVEHLYNVPSLGVWVPFNEAWGQFEAIKGEQLAQELDQNRLVDHASAAGLRGGDFQSAMCTLGLYRRASRRTHPGCH